MLSKNANNRNKVWGASLKRVFHMKSSCRFINDEEDTLNARI